MNQCIETWKKRLLDLGKRNRLLNYRDTKRGSIRILEPSTDVLWRSFVLDEGQLEFPYVDEDALEGLPVEEVERLSHRNSNVRTNKTLVEQQRSLRMLRNRARTHVSEQGVNVLYLAFGFLHWTEVSYSKQVIESPVVLVPASLQCESITSPFILSLHDDEIVVNPTLAYKLENDFGIALPALDEDAPIESYLGALRDLVVPHGWSVSDDVCLSLLSFSKINMYMDLERHSDVIADHPIIRALAGDPTGMEKNNALLADAFDYDSEASLIESHTVVDADSSQMDAIECAKRGASFVLQGPPGTGKSQTITNIIAECLADGKKVLFVSEKMAALDVVHRRLENVGLGDFCLVLHSHKANKKDVLAQLGKSLELSSQHMRLRDEASLALDRLQSDRDLLNGYARDLHTPIAPLGMTVFEVNGAISSCSDARDIKFAIQDIRSVSSASYGRMVGCLRELACVLREMGGTPRDNPWFAANVAMVSNELRYDVSAKTSRASDLLVNLIKLCDRIEELTLISCESICDIERTLPLLRICSNSPMVPIDWMTKGALDEVEAEATAARERQGTFLNLAIRYDQMVLSIAPEAVLLPAGTGKDDEGWRRALNSAQKRVSELRAAEPCLAVWEHLGTDEVKSLLDDLKTRIQRIQELRGMIEGIYKSTVYEADSEIINQRFGSLYDESFLAAKDHYAEDREAYLSVARPASVDLGPADVAVLLDKAQRMKDLRLWRANSRELAELDALDREISQRCEAEIESIPYEEIYLRYKEASSSFGKFINRQYRTDGRTVSSLVKASEGKLEDEQILDILSKLRRRSELRHWRDSSSEIAELSRLESDLHERLNDGIATIDCGGIARRYSLVYDNAFLGTLAQYEADVALLTSHLKERRTRSHNDLADDLTLLCELRRECDDFEGRADGYTRTLGGRYNGEGTNIDEARAALDRYQTLAAASEILESLVEILETDEGEYEHLRSTFGTDFSGIGTDWEFVRGKIDWAKELKATETGLDSGLPDQTAKRVCSDSQFAGSCASLADDLEAALARVPSDLKWFLDMFDESERLANMRIPALLDRLVLCASDLRALESWVDYRAMLNKCDEAGLGDCVAAIERERLAPDEIEPAFRKRFFTLWLDSVLPEYPTIASFRRRSQDGTIEEFRKLDRMQFDIARSMTRTKLINSLPSVDLLGSADTEVRTLMRELNKKRRIKPIRRLFSEIPNLVMTLRPCLMMSPLSVSLFLEARSFVFDTVIFDEASQVCTENAVGAIFRGKQVIIAGDSRQLPPTSFFEASLSDSDFDDDGDDQSSAFDDSGAFESVLDEATFLPSQRLLWHYRSRDERLIAFSNAKIYNHTLVTFPSPYEKIRDSGVEYVYVPNGVFDRGGSRANAIEAERVAELVFDHFTRNPGRSLGVIAFSSSQEAAIEAAIRRKRKVDTGFEALFDEEKEEPFFVKNLENVQGDERDTIIFSIGYARDAAGVMRMNFGPLSRSGGERRLNVAITRAKYNVKLVGSILPTDIVVERISADGPKLLRSYIEYAMRGQEVLEAELTVPDTVETESPFEDSVYDFLVGEGYEVATQVGCLGYRIDMAVKHPTLSGRFVLGVECDGATYHSARTARDRDRLRQEVLEGMGWRIYRIWSTDWIKDPMTEKRRLLDEVKAAINEYVEELPTTSMGSEKETKGEFEQPVIFEEIEGRKAIEINEDNPFGFAEMREPDYQSLPADADNRIDITDCIDLLVSCQYPIHCDVVAQKMSVLLGYQRAGSQIKRVVANAVSKTHTVERRGDFLYPKGCKSIPAYGGNGRNVKHISTDELCSALLIVARRLIGATRESLIESTARAYGFNRIGVHVAKAFSDAFDRLLEEEKLVLLDEKVRVM